MAKKLDRVYADHLAQILRPIIIREFQGNQTAFAKHVRVSQPQINALLKKGGDRSIGISVLIRLRSYLQMPLDEMLGLPRLHHTPADMASPDLVESIAAALDRKLQERASVGSMQAPKASAVSRKHT